MYATLLSPGGTDTRASLRVTAARFCIFLSLSVLRHGEATSLLWPEGMSGEGRTRGGEQIIKHLQGWQLCSVPSSLTLSVTLRVDATSLVMPQDALRRTSRLPRQARWRCGADGEATTAAPAGKLLLTVRSSRCPFPDIPVQGPS